MFQYSQKKAAFGKRGITLVELLLYVSIASALLLSVVLFLFVLQKSHIKNTAINEVELQGAEIMVLITSAIRNATSITSPAEGNAGDILLLTTNDDNTNPLSFYISEGQLYVTEAGDLPTSLTNNKVVVSDLVFNNVSRTDTPGTVKMSFTLTHVNPEGSYQYDFTKTFYTTTTIRDN